MMQKPRHILNHALLFSCAMGAPFAAFANPEGGRVVSGTAHLESNASTLTINQLSDQTVIDWRGFDIAPSETTRFKQPSASATAINRVKSSTPSKVMGTLTANGNVVLINPNGVVFGKDSKVDVNSLVATTASASKPEIKNGKLVLDQAGNPDAKIINNGTITAREAGLVGLVAPQVENHGIIRAKLGKVHLASGDALTVDFAGNNLLNIQVSDKVKKQIIDNTGSIEAEGGSIAITAEAGKNILDNLISVKGELKAPSIQHKNGEITITGENIALNSAQVDVSGAQGGGKIRIGGDYQGKGTLARAKKVTIDKKSTLTANATQKGKGGTVIVWSDKHTQFDGRAEAKGGALGGDGGLVETSSKGYLGLGGIADASAPRGSSGEWLLDPADIIISNTNTNITGNPNFVPDGTVATSYINATTIVSALNAGNIVTITTGGDAAGGNGDITLDNSANISTFVSSTGTLTLSAYRNILIEGDINMYGGLTLQADNTGAGSGSVRIAGSTINTHNAAFTVGGGAFAIASGSGVAASGAIGTSGIAIDNSTISSTYTILNGKGYAHASCNNNCYGVEITNSTLTSGVSSLEIYGVGGGSVASAGGNHAIRLDNASLSSSDYIFFFGNTTDQQNNSHLLSLGSNTTLTSTDRFIFVYDVVGNSGGLDSSGTGNIFNIGSGSLEYFADSLASTTGLNITAGGIYFYTVTAGTTMGIGPASGSTFNISDDFLSRTTASVYQFGDSSNTGTVTINSARNWGATDYITFYSADDIHLENTWTKTSGTNSTTVGLYAHDNIYNSNNAGFTASSGTIALTLGGGMDSSGGDTLTFTNAPLLVNGGSVTVGNGSHGSNILNFSGTLGGNTIIAGTNHTINLGTINADIAGTRNITLTANTINTTGAIGSTTKFNNITSTSNNIALGGALTGSGTLTLTPLTTSRQVKVNSGADDGTNYYLDTTEIGYLTDGWSGITIGKSTLTGSMTIGDSAWTDPVNFLTGATAKGLYNLTGTGNASFTVTGGTLLGLNGDITTAGGLIDLSSPTFIYATGGTRTINSNGGNVTIRRINESSTTSDLTINSGNGNITLNEYIYSNLGTATGKTITFNAGTGTLAFGSTVNGGANITATAGTITTASAWGGSSAMGTVSLTSSNSLSLPSITASSIFARTTGAAADITIGASKVLTASGAGNAITLAAGNDFINSSGAGALSTASGNWLIYSTNPDDNTLGSLVEGYHRYSCTYGGSCPTLGTGNGLLYSYTPTLTATPNALAGLTYGDVTPSLTGYGYTLSGYRTGDSALDTVTGTLTGSTTYAAGSNIGTYALNYASGTLASTLGYGFTYANNSTALSVAARTLTATLASGFTKIYDGLTTAALGTQYAFGNLYSTDDVTLSASTGSVDTANAGASKTVNFSGLSLGGTKAGNYTLATAALSAADGVVTPRALTVTANDKTMTYGSGNSFNGFTSSGLQNGETIGSVSYATNATFNGAHWNATETTPWTITPSAATGGTFNASNYTISYVNGNLNVIGLASNGGHGGDPVIPETPTTPSVPENPATPETPSTPSVPNTPTPPTTPTTPRPSTRHNDNPSTQAVARISEVKKMEINQTFAQQSQPKTVVVRDNNESIEFVICAEGSEDNGCASQ